MLGQPGDGVADLAAQLTRHYPLANGIHDVPASRSPQAPPLECLGFESLSPQPPWSDLTALDLVLLLERASNPTVDWRGALLQSGRSFQVLHPSEASLLQELQWALGHHLHRVTGRSPWPLRAEIPARWQGVCDTCSDPECEHRLFRRLMSDRRDSA